MNECPPAAAPGAPTDSPPALDAAEPAAPLAGWGAPPAGWGGGRAASPDGWLAGCAGCRPGWLGVGLPQGAGPPPTCPRGWLAARLSIGGWVFVCESPGEGRLLSDRVRMRARAARPRLLRCGVSGVFWVWRKKVVHRSAAMVAEELDLPAEPQLPELPRPPLAAPSSKLELLRSVSASAAPLRARLLRTSRRSTGAQPAVFVPPPAAACRCAAISGRCCRCRGLLRTRTSICSDVDSPAGAARMGVWA